MWSKLFHFSANVNKSLRYLHKMFIWKASKSWYLNFYFSGSKLFVALLASYFVSESVRSKTVGVTVVHFYKINNFKVFICLISISNMTLKAYYYVNVLKYLFYYYFLSNYFSIKKSYTNLVFSPFTKPQLIRHSQWKDEPLIAMIIYVKRI